MKLHRLPKVKVDKEAKRIGRGRGSGKGSHTVGRGTKGQKARNKVAVGFEGGQVPLYKKLPKKSGFRNPTKKDILIVSLNSLNAFKDGSEVTPEVLVKSGIVKRLPRGGIKILDNGELSKKLTLKGFLFSKSALEKIEKSGSKLLQ